MKPIVVVLLFAVTAQAAMPTFMRKIVRHHGKQRRLYEEYSDLITLTADDDKDCFKGLDMSTSTETVIDEKDLKVFYWHDDHAYAIKRFFSHTKSEKVGHSELDNALKVKAIKVALVECHYLKSTGLRQSCFADQLVTYYSLALYQSEAKAFYEHIAGVGKEITLEWVKKNKNFEEASTAAEELGAYSGDKVTIEEFEEYVTQESVNDDFRRCRASVDALGNFKWNFECLLNEVENHINDDLTEMDISVLFRSFDVDNSKKITLNELKKLPGVSTNEQAEKIMKLLNMPHPTDSAGKEEVEYAEFRTYMKSPTVEYQAEMRCTEVISAQTQEMDCLYDLVVELLLQNHDSIWLVMPDIEQQTIFEIIDTTNDGIIKEEDIRNLEDKQAKTRFFSEFNGDTDDDDVTLEEFNEYIDIPHMVYGTADCLLKKAKDRETCYPGEIFDIMINIKNTDDYFFHKWFDYYDTDGDDIIHTRDENEKVTIFGSKELETVFLQELGQGDDTISTFEFLWYVKQQRLGQKYRSTSEKQIGVGDDDIKIHYHPALHTYIDKSMTEYDTQEFFRALDNDHNHELTPSDFGGIWDKVKVLIKHIDGLGNDADDTVNFREFWLWIQVDKVKEKLEVCSEKYSSQSEEIKCYVKKFKEESTTLM